VEKIQGKNPLAFFWIITEEEKKFYYIVTAVWSNFLTTARESYGRGRIDTIDLLVVTSSDQIILTEKIFFIFLQNVEADCIEPSP
jgi:hypothetical protein